jgi:hypothetical protein
VVDKILAKTKELSLNGVDELDKNIDLTALHEKFKTAGIERINYEYHKIELPVLKQLMSGHPHLKKIYMDVRDEAELPLEAFAPAPKLEEIFIDSSSRAGLGNIPEIIAGCPNLEQIDDNRTRRLSEKETQELYEYLMASKPGRFFDISYEFTNEQARNLMEKYPTLTVGIRYFGGDKEYEKLAELCGRNRHIQEIVRGKDAYDDKVRITDAKTLQGLIEKKVLAECLELMEPKRRPSFEKLCGSMDGFHDAVKKSYGNEYSKVIAKVADLTGAVDFKNEIDLRQAIAKDKVMEFLNGFADDKRPNVRLLNGHQVDDVTPFENLAKKKKNRMELAAVIEAFKPSDKDLDALAAASNAKSALHGVVEYVKSERQEKARKEKERARFAQWKAKNIRDDK